MSLYTMRRSAAHLNAWHRLAKVCLAGQGHIQQQVVGLEVKVHHVGLVQESHAKSNLHGQLRPQQQRQQRDLVPGRTQPRMTLSS